jgi:hypothetical protein
MSKRRRGYPEVAPICRTLPVLILDGRLKRKGVCYGEEADGPAAAVLDSRVQQLEEELHRVERERDILKKALAIFSQKI